MSCAYAQQPWVQIRLKADSIRHAINRDINGTDTKSNQFDAIAADLEQLAQLCRNAARDALILELAETHRMLRYQHGDWQRDE